MDSFLNEYIWIFLCLFSSILYDKKNKGFLTTYQTSNKLNLTQCSKGPQKKKLVFKLKVLSSDGLGLILWLK